jgi:exodeoxyribonuclease V alpha subunit
VLGDTRAALATLDEQRLLCATAADPTGAALESPGRAVDHRVDGEPIWSDWYAGRPVLVTANDYGLGLYNGDTGVAVAGATICAPHRQCR